MDESDAPHITRIRISKNDPKRQDPQDGDDVKNPSSKVSSVSLLQAPFFCLFSLNKCNKRIFQRKTRGPYMEDFRVVSRTMLLFIVM